MRNQLVDFTEQVNSGTFPDRPNNTVPLWKTGQNVVFDKEGPRPIYGFSRAAAKLSGEPVYGMEQAFIQGARSIYFGNSDGIFQYRDDIGTVQDVTPDDLDCDCMFWSFAQWGEWMLAANRENPIQIQKLPDDDFEELSTGLQIDIVAKEIISFKTHLIAFGTDSEAREIRWCSSDNVEDWEPRLNNSARDLYIRDMAGEIIAAASHPQGILFYGESTIHLLSWVGPPFYFGTRRLSTNAGVFGKNAITVVGGTHFGMGPDGLWAFAPGQGEPQYLDRGIVHNHIYRDLNWDYRERCNVWYDQQQNLVIFSYPSSGQEHPDKSVALNVATGTFCPLDFAATVASRTAVFQHTSAADFRGEIYFHGIPGAGGGLPFDGQGFIALGSDMTIFNTYGKLGYGELGYGGP